MGDRHIFNEHDLREFGKDCKYCYDNSDTRRLDKHVYLHHETAQIFDKIVEVEANVRREKGVSTGLGLGGILAGFATSGITYMYHRITLESTMHNRLRESGLGEYLYITNFYSYKKLSFSEFKQYQYKLTHEDMDVHID